MSDEEDSHISVILLDSHRGFYFPPFAKADGFETTDCLECLQILDILIYGRRVCFKAGDWTLCTILDIVHYIRIWSSRTENILHAFLHSNIEESTFHHLRWSPSLSREENVLHASLRTAFAFFSFTQRKKCHMQPLFPGSNIQHSTFHHPPAKTGLSIVWKSKIS